jgi:biopolymer transport protein TolQ
MNSELNVLGLILGASLPVKLVLGILIGFSIASWFIIFRKKALLDRANRSADEFEERFWSGADLAGLFKELTSSGERVVGSAAIFEAGFREFARLRQRRGVDSRALLEGAQRAMRVASTREADRLEQNLEFLANVGSISPYIGLFGTVWGIMIAFQGLANVKEATIAMVAPGISEALIATAMGLFAAIPAVWAYNRFSTKLERIAVRYDTFVEEFSSILARQAHVDE